MIIVLAHDKGGTGKTTTAINIAVELLKEKSNLKVLDIDPKQMTRLFFEMRFENFPNKRRPEIISIESSDDLIDVINNLDEDDNLLIDTGGFDKDLNRIAMSGADHLIVPLKDNEIELHGFSSFIPVLDKIYNEYPDRFVAHILLNRIHESKKKYGVAIEDYIRESGKSYLSLMSSVLRSRLAYEVCYGEGLSVVEYEEKINKKRNKKDKSAINASKEVGKLIKEILNGKN